MFISKGHFLQLIPAATANSGGNTSLVKLCMPIHNEINSNFFVNFGFFSS